MKKQSLSNIILLPLCLLLTVPVFASKKQEFTQTIKKIFPTTALGTVEVDNKKGDVEVIAWDKEQVSIKVVIVVETCNESKAQDLFEKIKIDFSNGASFVKAITNIEDKTGGIWNQIVGCPTDYKINYRISMPRTNALTLSNRYGDVYVDELSANTKLTLKYGNLKMEGVEGNLDLDLDYGNSYVIAAGNLLAEVKYSKLEFEKLGEASITSKYSTFRIGKMETLESTTKYDKYRIEEVKRMANVGKYDNWVVGKAESVEIQSRYTDVKVDELDRQMVADLEYGGAKIQELGAAFKDLQLKGKYAHFKVYVEEGTEFSLKASGKYAGMDFPRAMLVTQQDEERSSRSVEGRSGSGKGGVIHADLDYGSLKIVER